VLRDLALSQAMFAARSAAAFRTVGPAGRFGRLRAVGEPIGSKSIMLHRHGVRQMCDGGKHS
jgi:hypothetical protein